MLKIYNNLLNDFLFEFEKFLHFYVFLLLLVYG